MRFALLLFYCASIAAASASSATWSPSATKPPAPAREFRGAWIASVGNIDWPSRRDLTTEQQKSELIRIFELAERLHLNALLLQVRPSCDALYQSSLEPWSEYLTGQMGKAPQPFYDPLHFAVQEARKRGIELHAWFNPFRAGHLTRKSGASATHITRARPHLVRHYGNELWLDPGDKAVHDHSLAVMLDVVRRYDVDGIVVDDYFYPYPVKDTAGKAVPFPDGPTWRTYSNGGGRLTLEDWRRENVNVFVQQLYSRVKAEKAWVKVGVSPFGIWRPGHPPSVKGLDAYAVLYADSVKWLRQGWLDYVAPQLYWNIDAPEQSFPELLNWWASQNDRKRHLWPAISANRIGPNRPADEIMNQVRLTREHRGAEGNIHWSVRAFLRNAGAITDALAYGHYSSPALVPASRWLDATPPAAPKLNLEQTATGLAASWQSGGAEVVAQWVVQARNGNEWSLEILPGARKLCTIETADVVAVSAVDRCGNLSNPAVLERREPKLP
jgi:uncharacterized lipoprotein YddW (UPF0748 family)